MLGTQGRAPDGLTPGNITHTVAWVHATLGMWVQSPGGCLQRPQEEASNPACGGGQQEAFQRSGIKLCYGLSGGGRQVEKCARKKQHV